MSQGYLCLLLHAHLPFVRHPEHEEFLEEDWLYQAIVETYIPLLQIMQGWMRDDVPFQLTLSLSPTLLSMLDDPLLQARALRYIDRSLELADKEIKRTRKEPDFQQTALMYRDRLQQARTLFHDQYSLRLIDAFRELETAGNVELITCAATHAYLPLLHLQPGAVRAQIELAVQTHQHYLGKKPRGIWLPECGYEPGIESYLEDAGLEYFFVDAHGVLFATPRPLHGVYAPITCTNGVSAFGRDIESSKQVWSAHEGYPGDFAYRDFYRDIGFDLDEKYVRPYIAATGDRKMTGFKYFRITGPTASKEPYQVDAAHDQAALHAEDFLIKRKRQIEQVAAMMDKPPLVVMPYDAELFGHWWHEGPQWLDNVMRKSAADQSVFQWITPSDYLAQYSEQQEAHPAASSWGYRGYHEHWLNHQNDWIYPHLHAATDRMAQLAHHHKDAAGLEERALNQAAKELLLAQASDWPFILRAETSMGYARAQLISHLGNFNRLYEQIVSRNIIESELTECETHSHLFPFLNFKIFNSSDSKVREFIDAQRNQLAVKK